MYKSIGIIGSGLVAQTLAAGLSREGCSVMLGTSHPEKLYEFSESHAAVQIASFEKATRFGEIVFLCVKGNAAEVVVKALPAEALKGKTVIDTTNPIADKPPVNGVLSFFTTLDESLLERLQKLQPGANFVKAFNSVGNSLMVHPELPGGKPSMFICGNDVTAKKEAGEIARILGWLVEDMGQMEAARAIEPLCMLWCIPGFLNKDWVHAFKVLR